MFRLGLIVNPVAGVGGPAGLKGSDGVDIQQQAISAGYQPNGPKQAKRLIAILNKLCGNYQLSIELKTCANSMGESYCDGRDMLPLSAIEKTTVVYQPIDNKLLYQSSGTDSERASVALIEHGVDLLLFVGGDGTARNIFDGIGDGHPVLGVPAGVKIQSSVFAVSTEAAAHIVMEELKRYYGNLEHVSKSYSLLKQCQQREVMDIDEPLLRQGIVAAKHYGYLSVLDGRSRLQGSKSRRKVAGDDHCLGIAQEVLARMEPDTFYVLGPGSTTFSIKQQMGGGTLLGVDVYQNQTLIMEDANQQQLEQRLSSDSQWCLIVTCIGGQGFVIGRGNQQISFTLLSTLSKSRLWIVATVSKLVELQGRPLLIDSGSTEINTHLSGHTKVITNNNEQTAYPINIV
ncbi:ATP-NAD kinase family protein [Aliivibrio kagoshimensis]|uniref:ATP-NAD kinase family protein n=1 Tax=Aliivibrio kagoshimensis TaxID=2910230 RepID=UPI003D0DFCAD